MAFCTRLRPHASLNLRRLSTHRVHMFSVTTHNSSKLTRQEKVVNHNMQISTKLSSFENKQRRELIKALQQKSIFIPEHRKKIRPADVEHFQQNLRLLGKDFSWIESWDHESYVGEYLSKGLITFQGHHMLQEPVKILCVAAAQRFDSWCGSKYPSMIIDALSNFSPECHRAMFIAAVRYLREPSNVATDDMKRNFLGGYWTGKIFRSLYRSASSEEQKLLLKYVFTKRGRFQNEDGTQIRKSDINYNTLRTYARHQNACRSMIIVLDGDITKEWRLVLPLAKHLVDNFPIYALDENASRILDVILQHSVNTHVGTQLVNQLQRNVDLLINDAIGIERLIFAVRYKSTWEQAGILSAIKDYKRTNITIPKNLEEVLQIDEASVAEKTRRKLPLDCGDDDVENVRTEVEHVNPTLVRKFTHSQKLEKIKMLRRRLPHYFDQKNKIDLKSNTEEFFLGNRAFFEIHETVRGFAKIAGADVLLEALNPFIKHLHKRLDAGEITKDLFYKLELLLRLELVDRDIIKVLLDDKVIRAQTIMHFFVDTQADAILMGKATRYTIGMERAIHYIIDNFTLDLLPEMAHIIHTVDCQRAVPFDRDNYRNIEVDKLYTLAKNPYNSLLSFYGGLIYLQTIKYLPKTSENAYILWDLITLKNNPETDIDRYELVQRLMIAEYSSRFIRHCLPYFDNQPDILNDISRIVAGNIVDISTAVSGGALMDRLIQAAPSEGDQAGLPVLVNAMKPTLRNRAFLKNALEHTSQMHIIEALMMRSDDIEVLAPICDILIDNILLYGKQYGGTGYLLDTMIKLVPKLTKMGPEYRELTNRLRNTIYENASALARSRGKHQLLWATTVYPRLIDDVVAKWRRNKDEQGISELIAICCDNSGSWLIGRACTNDRKLINSIVEDVIELPDSDKVSMFTCHSMSVLIVLMHLASSPAFVRNCLAVVNDNFHNISSTVNGRHFIRYLANGRVPKQTVNQLEINSLHHHRNQLAEKATTLQDDGRQILEIPSGAPRNINPRNSDFVDSLKLPKFVHKKEVQQQTPKVREYQPKGSVKRNLSKKPEVKQSESSVEDLLGHL